MKIFFVFAIFAICFVGTLSLSCPRCYRNKCKPVKCNYGVGSDICGCCDRCLKGPGESCGGSWNNLGHCGSGFVCQFADYRDFLHVANQPDGVCVSEQQQKRG